MDFDDLDLDELRERSGTKWSKVGEDVLAAWIADMDFRVAPVVREAIMSMVDGGDLGYPPWPGRATPLREEFGQRMARRYGWHADPALVREFTDTIHSLQVLLRLGTRPGDAVAVHTPCYPPFRRSLQEMGRRFVPLRYEWNGGAWGLDPDDLRRQIRQAGVKALILVNPHNPTGRVLSRAELLQIGEVALDAGLLVVSDEIHADLAYAPHRHIPFASLGPEIAARTVTLTSATKAFNLAGLRCSLAHVGVPMLHERLSAQPSHLFGTPSSLGVVGTLAAWRRGDVWLRSVLNRLERNRDEAVRLLSAAGFGCAIPEASYFLWLAHPELEADPASFFLEEAGVKLSAGSDFGPDGHAYARLNFATSRPILGEILRRMTTAVQTRVSSASRRSHASATARLSGR